MKENAAHPSSFILHPYRRDAFTICPLGTVNVQTVLPVRSTSTMFGKVRLEISVLPFGKRWAELGCVAFASQTLRPAASNSTTLFRDMSGTSTRPPGSNSKWVPLKKPLPAWKFLITLPVVSSQMQLPQVRQDDGAAGRQMGGADHVGRGAGDRPDILAVPVDLHQLVAHGDESVTVGQAPGRHGLPVHALLPDDLVLQRPFGDEQAAALGDQHVAAGQHLGIDRRGYVGQLPAHLALVIEFLHTAGADAAPDVEDRLADQRVAEMRPCRPLLGQVDLHAVVLPPGSPGIAILLAALGVGVRHAQDRCLVAGKVEKRFLDAPRLPGVDLGEEIDEHRHGFAVIGGQQTEGGTAANLDVGVGKQAPGGDPRLLVVQSGAAERFGRDGAADGVPVRQRRGECRFRLAVRETDLCQGGPALVKDPSSSTKIK